MNKIKEKKNNRRRNIWRIILCVLLLLLVVWFYRSYMSRTKVAFVNEQPITLQAYLQANNNRKIRLYDISVDELKKLKRCDIVMVNGMGLNISADQREQLKELAAKGKPIYTSMATNPDNNITNFTGDEVQLIMQYMMNGSRSNYRSMFNFLRRNIDGKLTSVGEITLPEQQPSDYLYYPADNNDDDPQLFTSVADFEKAMQQQGRFNEGASKIVVTGLIADMTELIKALSLKGYNVYPVSSMLHLIDYLEEIKPDAIVNSAHGRVGDHLVQYLTDNNVLLFDPVYVNATVEEWESDPMGMVGGFMSQSIVMPELDGAIRTQAIFALKKDRHGLLQPYAVPERLQEYVETIGNYLELRKKENSKKRIAIVYYKGPGQGSLVASGMEVIPSLYNMLVELRNQGYNLNGLPSNADELGRQLQAEGSLFNSFAAGDVEQYLKKGHPQWVSEKEYNEWCKRSMLTPIADQVADHFGPFPGTHNQLRSDDGKLAFPCLQYGNVVLVPQPIAGEGKDEFRIVHGTEVAPPYSYIAPYLWMRYAFQADALIHFGAHGSLEFTPKKQVALSSSDWPDRLVGTMPHFYLYTMDNVGEAMIARRRTYAGLQSYLTPPFHESELRNKFKSLDEKLVAYAENESSDKRDMNLEIKQMAIGLGLIHDLGLDSNSSRPFTDEEIERLADYKEELAAEKITSSPYILGVSYTEPDIRSSVFAMTVDPLAYSLYALDRLQGKAPANLERHKSLFDARYLRKAESLVDQYYGREAQLTDAQVSAIMGISVQQLNETRKAIAEKNAPKGMMAMMMKAASEEKGDSTQVSTMGMKKEMQTEVTIPEAKRSPMAKMMRKQMRKMMASSDANTMLEMARRMGADEEALKKMAEAMGMKDSKKEPDANNGKAKTLAMNDRDSIEKADASMLSPDWIRAVEEVEQALNNINAYRKQLGSSPKQELNSILNALNGGYTAPSPGGDPIANPNALPTGRNMFAINAEATPTEEAWRKGVALAENTIEEYRSNHGGDYPRKVAYSLWSGEFVQTGGATIAQVLYMLGVEPLRDRYGRVNDLRLIPSEELGRPRIDVVVQTSGQLRDLAASRLFLINRAVEMAANADNDKYDNMVKAGVDESERTLIDRGISPKEARSMSRYRIFGGLGGNYGTGIQSMVERGDAWEDDSEIAEVYMNNMGAFYGDEEHWMDDLHEAFSSALTRTDVVVQPRQNNTWGALTLDHVYEFMGGMNLAVREVTGKDPEAYFSDYRNRNNYRVQSGQEAIATEARTKLFNPTYMKRAFDGGTTPTDDMSEMVRNMYGWNVMKPEAVGDHMWNELYDVYINDKYQMGTINQFAQINPMALQEMTATMMETARKGYWDASPEQLARVAEVYTDFVDRFGPSGSSFDGENAKLQQFIAEHASPEAAQRYQQQMREQQASSSQEAQVMEKQTHRGDATEGHTANIMIAVGVVLALFVALIVWMRIKRKKA